MHRNPVEEGLEEVLELIGLLRAEGIGSGAAFGAGVAPLSVPLAELEVGESGMVRFVAGRHDGIERLMTLGLAPGARVRLSQRRPSFVVEVGETAIAIDRTLASAIFVQRLPQAAPVGFT